MRRIDNILGLLLLRNNCVIIPDLGGFVANNVAAKIDTVKGIILPPKKAINFNKNLINNDGLIVNFLSKEEGISYEEASQIIFSEIQQLKIELKEGKRISFVNVGNLFLNEVGKITFEQDRFFNLLLSSYGMGNVQFFADESISEVITASTPVEKEIVLPIDNKEKTKAKPAITPIITFNPIPSRQKSVAELSKVAPSEKPKEKVLPNAKPIEIDRTKTSSKPFIGKLIKYAAVASLATILFYSIWIPMKTDVLQSGIVYSEDFNPFTNYEAAQFKQSKSFSNLDISKIKQDHILKAIVNNLNTATTIFSYPFDDDLYIPVRRTVAKKQSIVPTQPIKLKENKVEKKTQTVAKVTKSNRSGKYDIIAGCFGNPNNAKDFIHKLKAQGFDAYQVDVKSGLHRISAGRFDKKSVVSSVRNKLDKSGISSWILTH